MSDPNTVSPVDLLVGISVSEPTNEELINFGLSELHIRHAFTEVMRHVLAAGWSVAYGGDFRPRGYTAALLDLVRTYERTVLSGPDHFTCYLAWPLWTELTDADRAELANIVTTVQVPAPEGAPASLAPVPDRTPIERWWNALALTAMRKRMTRDVGALVVVGGRVSGQQGLYPGVVEEASLALASDVPLYVAGGFGGCGRLLARVLDGEQQPAELSTDYQRAHTKWYTDLLEGAKHAGVPPDFGRLLAELSSRGLAGLNNGLDNGDNRMLLETANVDELIALILRGLFRLASDAGQ